MKLFTHNLLLCNVKGCNSNNFPLQIKATKIEKIETNFHEGFIRNMLSKLDWTALVNVCRELNLPLSEAKPTEQTTEEELRRLHEILFVIRIQEGSLVCRNCHREYPISNGIPNMLLTEDEV